MTSVTDILRAKPDPTVYTIGPAAAVFDAVGLMVARNIGALVVVEQDQVVGIVTEREVARQVIVDAVPARQLAVRAIMQAPVMIVSPQRTSEECMALMTEHRLRHLPVIDDGGRLCGLVSIGDLVKDIISEQKFIIEQLERYIAGQRA
ncbi:CBS domain-containing protein [Rivibacter subsaxonicus]|uniref:CBS domain protein n=1 Tax=Rivibacter subsaxonicus TaxID=457575 RepID=A0A4Q7VXH6_9BURK|nr:CBS domain-containing protein [Rivibacter subsaxonicus]RZU01059.1 CBS domain protein [Rivibacter subsaxonicus]